MALTLQQSVRADLDGLAALSRDVETFLTQGGVAPPARFKVQLALEEWLRNVIEYGVGSSTGRIDVRLDLDAERLTLILEDDTAAFDPGSVPIFDRTRPLEDRSDRGMGIHLLRRLTDELHYQRVHDRNQLRLVIFRES